MKHIVTKIFILSLLGVFLFYPHFSAAFLTEDLGLNLYKNLDEGLADLELKQYKYEVAGQNDHTSDGKIAENINNIIKEKYGYEGCILDNIDIQAVEIIAAGDISKLSEYISNNCKGQDSGINIKQIENITYEIKQIRNKYKAQAEQKSKKISDISRIGLYSDGTTDNSPFDIIVDLQDIDLIIFTNKLHYEGEEGSFLNDYLNDVSNHGKIKRDEDDEESGESSEEEINENEGNEDTPLEIEEISTPDGNEYVCAESMNESGLSIEELDKLKAELVQESESITSDITKTPYIPLLPDTNKIPGLNSNSIVNGYIGINDNSVWPCNDFFCINISFDTYNHKVLGYGESHSIENIIAKSNQHLKKAANTSLQQGKMSTNNFEIGLRDLNLPDQFHLGFIIQKKPPPILNLENIIEHNSQNQTQGEGTQSGEDNHEITKKLKEYYKNAGLDFERANDLHILNSISSEWKNVIDGAELSNDWVAIRQNEIAKIKEIMSKKNNFINDNLDRKINAEILVEFYNEFAELERFVKAMDDYVKTLNGLIIKMREIPIFKE